MRKRTSDGLRRMVSSFVGGVVRAIGVWSEEPVGCGVPEGCGVSGG
nr:MAG TPA: hypothetical protein [Caudoviricetes sp.]DAQ50083.1 MAG TPA: hypothetical protein [Caudoviricetes sp.]